MMRRATVSTYSTRTFYTQRDELIKLNVQCKFVSLKPLFD